MNTFQAVRHPALPHSISEPLSDLAYHLTVTYGLRLRLVTPHGHDLPIHATPRPGHAARGRVRARFVRARARGWEGARAVCEGASTVGGGCGHGL